MQRCFDLQPGLGLMLYIKCCTLEISWCHNEVIMTSGDEGNSLSLTGNFKFELIGQNCQKALLEM